MKTPISQVLSQTFLLIVQFSKTNLKTLSWMFFMNGRICGFCVIFFQCSINQFPKYRHLRKAIAARLLINFTFVLQRISKWKFLIISCYTEVLFPRYSESNRTHIFVEQTVQSVQKYSEKKFQEGKCSSPKTKEYFRKKMFVIDLLRLFSIVLLSHFSCANEATQPEADKLKKDNGFICSRGDSIITSRGCLR